MTSRWPSGAERSISSDDPTLRELAGYLNFSNGKPDVAFQRNLNELFQRLGPEFAWKALPQALRAALADLNGSSAAFADTIQAEAVVSLTFERLWPVYRRHHADLLFHLADEDFQQPFFLARLFEAVLSQGGGWDEVERIVDGALDQLNDFLGYRPVAVLENARRMEPYPHERYRPIPLYIRDVGAAAGPYRDLIAGMIAFFRETPPEILHSAYFDLDQLDELCIDVRAHDHTHPVNKRTNYMFGEWDPHIIDTKGRYRRFIVRKIILDALLNWIEMQDGIPDEEVMYDASAVLCGTILMASSISGSGPETHDSTISLTALLPKVARQRDAFYARLMQIASGARAKRLVRAAKLTQQPFGHVRQQLNMYLAQYGALQVEHRFLAQLFARMGYPEASREQAGIIPSPSARFESEIQLRLTSARLRLDRGEVEPAIALLKETEDLLHRGIECGAIVDPWNILGFQGNFPLFSSREDAIPDERVETLLELIERIFDGYARALGEAAAKGDETSLTLLSNRFRGLADWWDQFASGTVDDLPEVPGSESWDSAVNVAQALGEWRAAGGAAGDISFWRQHVDRFRSAKAYALVVDALLEKGDHVAAMGLMMQWLSQSDEVGLESGPHSIYGLLLKWMNRLVQPPEEAPAKRGKKKRGEPAPPSTGDLWSTVARMFDYLEANSGELWRVPSLGESVGRDLGGPGGGSPPRRRVDDVSDPFADEDEAESSDDLFGAAYDDVVFRESALDGEMGDVLEGPGAPEHTEFDAVSRFLEPRLKFLMTLAQLWQVVVAGLVSRADDAGQTAEAADGPTEARFEALQNWLDRSRAIQAELERLLNEISRYEIEKSRGDYDSNVEYDMQLQTKFYLQHTIIATHINCRIAELSLSCCLPGQQAVEGVSQGERLIVEVYRGVLSRDVLEVRRLLPQFLKWLSKRPLLYVPLDHGGHPDQILIARTAQTDIRFLLSQLPRLGMLRETWHLLQTAYRMERASRPNGMVVTEFDRLFRTAMKNSLECLIESSAKWDAGRYDDEDLIDIIGEVVEHYSEQWLRHSDTTRLSTVEALEFEVVWDDVRAFIVKYGADLFHARHLTLGNVRAILHTGIEAYLDYLAEEADPLHPLQLIEDLESGAAEREQVVRILELIYGSVVDKFDRFLEYNTTTTQSDYGEQFYTFLDFLRVEAAYDHDAWNAMPVCIAHEALARAGKSGAVQLWEYEFQAASAEMADKHLEDLAEMEQAYGMRLPSITDRLNERFVKPLAVNRMVALVEKAMEDARRGKRRPAAFAALRQEIDEYLDNSSGSGIDVPPWLQALEKEVDRRENAPSLLRQKQGLEVRTPMLPVSLREMRQQLRIWKQPLAPREKKKSQPPKSPDAPGSSQRKPPQRKGRKKDE